MAKYRAKLFNHGGTVGMIPVVRGDKIVLVEAQDDVQFRAACEPVLSSFSDVIEIHYEHITNKDSSNGNPFDWENLSRKMFKAQEDGYDAIGATNGTDTFAWMVAALALALGGTDPTKRLLRIPVGVTGAQNSIHIKGGDGEFNLANLIRMLIAAIEMGTPEVLVNFFDRVMLGCRTMKTSERKFDAMDSPAYPLVGRIDARGVHLDKSLLHQASKPFMAATEPAASWGPGVLALTVSPGLEPLIVQDIVERGRVKALILHSLGEGNVPNQGAGAYSLIPVIEYAVKQFQMPVFISSQFTGGTADASHYDVGLAAIEAGAISCLDHTAAATEVKIRWLLGTGLCKTIDDFRAAMHTNFVGEVTVPTAATAN